MSNIEGIFFSYRTMNGVGSKVSSCTKSGSFLNKVFNPLELIKSFQPGVRGDPSILCWCSFLEIAVLPGISSIYASIETLAATHDHTTHPQDKLLPNMFLQFAQRGFARSKTPSLLNRNQLTLGRQPLKLYKPSQPSFNTQRPFSISIKRQVTYHVE